MDKVERKVAPIVYIIILWLIGIGLSLVYRNSGTIWVYIYMFMVPFYMLFLACEQGKVDSDGCIK